MADSLDLDNLDLSTIETALTDKPEVVDLLKNVVGLAKTLKANNADLVAKRDTEAAKTREKLNGKGVVDAADLNAALERVAKIEKERDEEKARAVELTAREQESNLKSSIVSVAGANDAISGEQVFILMKAEGLIGLNEGKPFYIKRNELGQPVTISQEEAVKLYLDKHKHLKKSSGTMGSGGNHAVNPNGKSNGLLSDAEARAILSRRNQK